MPQAVNNLAERARVETTVTLAQPSRAVTVHVGAQLALDTCSPGARVRENLSS